RRKIKEKNPTSQKPPMFEFSTLRTKTVRVLIVVCFFASFAIHTPFLFIVPLATSEDDGLAAGMGSVGDQYLLQTILGLAHTFGTCLFGMLVVGNSDDCYVGRRYLSQAGLLGLSFSCASPLALGGFRGLSLLAVLCGALSGGLGYSLKLLVFERLRARHFSRAWGFVHWSMSAPIILILPITQYLSSPSSPSAGGALGNSSGGGSRFAPGALGVWWTGDLRVPFYVSSGCALLASVVLFALPVSHRAACRILYADPFQRNSSLSSSWHTCSQSGSSSFRNNSASVGAVVVSKRTNGGVGTAGSLHANGNYCPVLVATGSGAISGALSNGNSCAGLACNGGFRWRERGTYHSPGGPTGLVAADSRAVDECVSCRARLDRLQRTVSWATSVDLLNAQMSNFEDNDDFNEIGKRPELLTCISEEGLVEMVDPTLLLSECCECELAEDMSDSPESPTKTGLAGAVGGSIACAGASGLGAGPVDNKRVPSGSFGHLHTWQPAMTPIEEVTSTV
ncbi:monocarboxylate transporter 12-like, partial [Tropilaelaps mercedesae]